MARGRDDAFDQTQITAYTPGAVFEPYADGGQRGSNGGYWRMPTVAEQADISLNAQIAGLPQNIRDAMNLGQLIPQYSTISTGGGRRGEATANNGITSFISPGPNDTTITYDLAGNKTGQTQNQHGGGGFFNNLINSIGSGVSDFLSDPAKATTNLFENPGVKEAALITAAIYAPELLGDLGTKAAVTGAGADAAATAVAENSGLDVLNNLSEFGGYPSLEASESAAFQNAIGANAGLDAVTSAVSSLPSLIPEAPIYDYDVPTLPSVTEAPIYDYDVPTLPSVTEAPIYDYDVPTLPNTNPTDLLKGAYTAKTLFDQTKSLFDAFNSGAKLGSLDGGSSGSSGSSGKMSGLDLARVGQMGSGNSLLHAVQGLYSGSPTGFAEGGSTSSGLDNYNPLKGDTVKVGDVGKNITLSRELASLYGDNVLAHGGQPHVDPRLMALIRARANPADKQHPNYDGTPVFRTGGLEGLGGKYVEGKGDGTSDDITAMLANGEYVFSADVVSALGNGSNKAGAEKLNGMVHSIRARARSAPPDKLPPDAKSPLEYLKPSKGTKHA